MELFDKKYVHFLWTDELEGKDCFTADDMESLIKAVNNNNSRHKVSHTISNYDTSKYDLRTPFRNDTMTVHQFAYYDPNYETKIAYAEGKQVQFKNIIDNWKNDDCPQWRDDTEYRIKPEELSHVAGVCEMTNESNWCEKGLYCLILERLHKRIADLEKQIEKMKEDLRKVKSNYDNSRNKTSISVFSAEYRLLCGIKSILEKWETAECQSR